MNRDFGARGVGLAAERNEAYIGRRPIVIIGGKNYDRRTVTEIEVGEGVTEIERETFDCCLKLYSIKLPSTLLSIGVFSFARCLSLEDIKLPTSLITVSYGAFCGSSLRSIIIPNTVTTLGVNVFGSCKFLTSATLPNAIPSIKSSTFYNCSSLETIFIPASVRSFESGAFEDCLALRSVNIPFIATVHSSAFKGCSKLEAHHII